MSKVVYEFEDVDPTYIDISDFERYRTKYFSENECPAFEKWMERIETVSIRDFRDFAYVTRSYAMGECPNLKAVQFMAPLDVVYKEMIHRTKKDLRLVDEQYRGPLEEEFDHDIVEVTRNKLDDDIEEVDLSDTKIRSLPPQAFKGYYYLQSVRLPTTLTSLGAGCFMRCHSLESLELPDSLVEIGPNCFSGCRCLELRRVPPLVTVLEPGTFDGCLNIKRLELPSNLRSIYSCFRDCGVTKLELPTANRLYLGEEAFRECAIQKIQMGSNVFCDRLTFLNCTNLESVISESPMTNDLSFSRCSSLVEIVLPKGTKKIGRGCFSHCIQLRRIYVPMSVKRIEESAFEMCTSLERIAVPWDAVIERDAFCMCRCRICFKMQ